MSVNCKVYLPHNVRVGDVADVIAILAGCPAEKRMFSSRSGGWSTEVPAVKVSTTSIVEMAHITFAGRSCSYHFEETQGRLVLMSSTAFWIAIAQGLVEFFGGHVDFQDCDDSDNDHCGEWKDNETNHPTDGAPWYALQQRKLDLKPLTLSEIEGSRSHAAYADDSYPYFFDDSGHLYIPGPDVGEKK